MAKYLVAAPSMTPWLTSNRRKEKTIELFGFDMPLQDKWELIPLTQIGGTPFADCYQTANSNKQFNTPAARLISLNHSLIVTEGSETYRRVTQGFLDILNKQKISTDPFYILSREDVQFAYWTQDKNLSFNTLSLSRGASHEYGVPFTRLHMYIFEKDYGILSTNEAKAFFTADKVAKFLGYI